MQKLPATLDMDEDFRRMRYVRYADDFLISVIGSKEDCVKIKEDIKIFLLEQLILGDKKTAFIDLTFFHDLAAFTDFSVFVKYLFLNADVFPFSS